MFLIRRSFKIQQGKAREAAEIITQIGRGYQSLDQRRPIRVYLSGTTVPGPADTVYMEWTEEALMSAYREGNEAPEWLLDLFRKLEKVQISTEIEFFEMYSGV